VPSLTRYPLLVATVKRDYYEILGVGRTASDDEIRRAFRSLARRYHPDVNKDEAAAEMFKQINEAYEVLSDPDKRQRYDMFGHAGVEGAGVGFSGGFGPFADLFATFFGGETLRRERTGPVRGSDLRLTLEIEFLDAIFGTEKQVSVPREQACSRCDGTGAEPGTKRSQCSTCRGSGEVRSVQNSIFGRVVNVVTCPRCGGQGQIIETPCATCGGVGREQVTRELTITIPAGIDDGQQLRISAEGEGGERGGRSGDLYVLIRVRSHRVFERRGLDVVYELPMSPALAVLGGDVEVPTVDGGHTLKVPPGTQTGSVLRIRGKGVPQLGGSGRGDQLVVTRIVVPTHMSAKERKLWQELSGTAKEPERAGEEGLLGRIRDAFRG
jgi:molecular chaperone DnaJ